MKTEQATVQVPEQVKVTVLPYMGPCKQELQNKGLTIPTNYQGFIVKNPWVGTSGSYKVNAIIRRECDT